MEQKMAVITKQAYNAGKIGTIQYTDECYDNKDSGWRFFYGDEDDHILDRMECFRLIPLEEAVKLLPELEEILGRTECTYYHFDAESGAFTESDCFASDDSPAADPFMQAFMRR